MDTIAAMYARVSTLQQEQEATIDSQVAALESYAQEQGYGLVKEFYFLDQAVSGAQLARPALDRLRDLAAEGLFQTVLCLSPDRLARQYVHQCVLMDEFQRAGVKVIFVNQPSVEDNPQGQLLIGIQGLFAEYERATITDRLRRGKLYRIRKEGLSNPVPPYGYRYIPISQPDGGRWEVDPREGPVVQQIYEWYTQDQGCTLWQIVERLEALGDQAPPRGEHWRYSTVERILQQQDYTGESYYNQTQVSYEGVGQPRRIGRGLRRTPRHLPRPKEEWILIRVPALITQDQYERAQEQLANKQRFSSRNNKKHFYLLRSLLVCGVCGHTLVGRTAGKYVAYYCSQQKEHNHPDPAIPKHSCSIRAREIEPIVWQSVCTLLRNPRLIEDAWASQSPSKDSQPGEADRLQTRLKALQRQWERLIDLFQEELIEKAEFTQRKERIDKERQTINERLQQLNRQANKLQAKQQMIDDFVAYCHKIEASLTNPTPELQQEVIRLLIDHVVVGKDEIVIKHIVPTDDDCRLLPGRR
jgi:site-specific DNA recombinase